MSTLFEHEILVSAIRSSISDLGLTDDDLEVVLKSMVSLALEDATFQEKFSYAMNPQSYRTSAPADNPIIVGETRTDAMPTMPLPVYTFKRKSRPTVKLKARLDPTAMAFFNRHYDAEFDIVYSQIGDHDHAVAAMSRKIEYDYLIKYAWDNYANPLLLPTNYDFSLIDVGGDWSTVVSRKQYGVHVCNPILDSRDRTRDLRKRMRDNSNFPATAYVCRQTFQDCTKTAPMAISLHSSYDIDPNDIVRHMARRGISSYAGTMFIPENLENITRYSDKDYGYNILVDRPNNPVNIAMGFMSKAPTDYSVKRKASVIYTFPNGESREYCHDLDNLIKYSENKTFKLRVSNSSELVIFDYRIIRRVGSLIYFEFIQNFEPLPANLVVSKTVQSQPYDGYRVKLDSAFLKTSLLNFSSSEVYIPRGLFDVVANYCLTRISSLEFNIEQAITYTRSVMSSIQINESVLAHNADDDSFELMVACGLAAYQWSHQRYQLLESRVPYRKFIEKYMDSEDSVNKIVNSVINVETAKSELKSVVSKVGTSIVNDVMLNNQRIKTFISRLSDVVSKIKSPCILELVDMMHQVAPIDIALPDDDKPTRRVSTSTIYCDSFERLLPTYPDYDQVVISSVGRSTHKKSRFVESQKLVDEIISKRFQGLREYNTLQPVETQIYSDEMEEAEALNAIEDPIDDDKLVVQNTGTEVINHETHCNAIKDFIHLAREGDKERIETAKDIVRKCINSDQLVPDHKLLKADIKHEPIVMSCQNAKVMAIANSVRYYYKGEQEFDEMITCYNETKFCTLLRDKNSNTLEFAIVSLKDGLIESKENRHISPLLDVIYIAEVQLLLSEFFRSLFKRTLTEKICHGNMTKTILTNGVAGCGKTHAQVHKFAEQISLGNEPAIFSATKAAAQQALSRLHEMNVLADINNVCTTDSFLMNKSKWKTFTHVFIDEALQLHCGKIYAVLEITNPIELIGYGDKRQITFINFTRFTEPSVDTDFPWQEETQVISTRRISQGKRIAWLRDERLYGPDFYTAKSAGTKDTISVYGELTSLDKKLSIEWLYKMVSCQKSEPLLVLVYRADVANDLRMRLKVTRSIPDAGSEHRMAVATIGESQGEDVPHSLLLRLSTKDEALYAKSDQTIVALTRSSISWGYLRVPSLFPSLLEKVISESNERITFQTVIG